MFYYLLKFQNSHEFKSFVVLIQKRRNKLDLLNKINRENIGLIYFWPLLIEKKIYWENKFVISQGKHFMNYITIKLNN